MVSKLFCRALYSLVFALPLVLPATSHAEANFPTRPVTILVGSAPGGSNDTLARAVARQLETEWGQAVVVENKPAAGGVLANALLAKSKPDGYTLVLQSSTFTTVGATHKNLQYDPIESFAPVAMVAKGPLLLTASQDSGFKNIDDLVAYAKANPGKVNYGTSGVGSILHFATELFADSANIDMTHIPYKSMNPALTDLVGGRIEMIIGSMPSLLGSANANRIRALAVTSAQRFPTLPDIPSLEELGYQGSAVDVWWGILAPAGTPDAILKKINLDIAKIIETDRMKEFLLNQGSEPVVMKPDEFASHIKAEIERWRRIAQAKGIQNQ